MKIRSSVVPAPTFPEPFSRTALQETEARYLEMVKADLIANGYDGPETGGVLDIPHADGYASYMFADGGRQSCLIHLQMGDAWHSPDVQFLPRKEVLRRIEQGKRRRAIFGG